RKESKSVSSRSKITQRIGGRLGTFSRTDGSRGDGVLLLGLGLVLVWVFRSDMCGFREGHCKLPEIPKLSKNPNWIVEPEQSGQQSGKIKGAYLRCYNRD